MASTAEPVVQERKRWSFSGVEGGGSVPSMSRDKRSGLVVPDGYSPPPPSSRRQGGTKAEGHGGRQDSSLDLSTKLRLTEAEVAILQREVAELITDRNTLEAQATQYKVHCVFAMQTCGRLVEERDEAVAKFENLEKGVFSAYQSLSEQPPGSKVKKNKVKHEVDQLRVSLETQIRVCEQLEGERDRSNDEYEFALARLNTVLKQHQQLVHAAGEMGRERDRALAEVDILRQQLAGVEQRESDLEGVESTGPSPSKEGASLEETPGSCAKCNKCISDRPTSSPVLPPSDRDELLLLRNEVARVRERLCDVEREREEFRTGMESCLEQLNQFEQNIDQAHKDRRASESIVHLWQKKYEKIADEKLELREDMLTAHERISFLQEQLAQERVLRQSLRHPNLAAHRSMPAEKSRSTEVLTPGKMPGPSTSTPIPSSAYSPHHTSVDSLGDSRLNLRTSDWDLFDASAPTTSSSRDDEVSWI